MSDEPVDLDHEEQERAKADKAEKDRRTLVVQDLAWVLSSKQGRRFVARLLDRCGVELPIFNPNGSTMTHAEGRRSIGIELLQELKANHRDAWLAMLTEANPPKR